MKHHLVLKSLIGYLLIVLLPVTVLYYYVTTITTHLMIEGEGERRQGQLVQATLSLERDMDRVRNVYELVRQNSWIIEYLRYPYKTDWEPVYNFNKHIQPYLQYITMITPSVADVRLYSDTPQLMLGGRFFPAADLGADADGYRVGRWEGPDADGGLRFRCALMDDYVRAIGVAEIQMAPSALTEFLAQLGAQPGAMGALVNAENAPLLGGALPEGLSEPTADGYTLEAGYIVNRKKIPALGAWAVSAWPEAEMTKPTNRIILTNGALLLGLLVLLSGIYVVFVRNLTHRLVLLSRHIHGGGGARVRPYTGKAGSDEIGELIGAYNQLAERNGALIQDIQRAERLKSAAEYEAFQAKIEPHFLYGTMESIRMMAEEVGDTRIADVILSFAKLLRYSLSPSSGNAQLADEIMSARRYMELQKLRFGARLRYEFDIDETLLYSPCPQFILQPLAENAISHGLEQRRGAVTVRVRLSGEPGHIVLSCEDDGVSIPEAQLSELSAQLERAELPQAGAARRGGYALPNINARVRLMYAPGSGLTLANREGGGVIARIVLMGEAT